jgi:hypothetical protein
MGIIFMSSHYDVPVRQSYTPGYALRQPAHAAICNLSCPVPDIQWLHSGCNHSCISNPLFIVLITGTIRQRKPTCLSLLRYFIHKPHFVALILFSEHFILSYLIFISPLTIYCPTFGLPLHCASHPSASFAIRIAKRIVGLPAVRSQPNNRANA